MSISFFNSLFRTVQPTVRRFFFKDEHFQLEIVSTNEVNFNDLYLYYNFNDLCFHFIFISFFNSLFQTVQPTVRFFFKDEHFQFEIVSTNEVNFNDLYLYYNLCFSFVF